MNECLICHRLFKNAGALGLHVNRTHDITAFEYKMKFGLAVLCKKCGKPICKRGTLSGFCNSCRDRTGDKNPFFDKKHTKETIDIIKAKCGERSKVLWKNGDYRNRVIVGATGVKRSSSFRNTQKANADKQFEDPNQRLSRSVTMKQSWKDGKIVPNHCSTSKIEQEFFDRLADVSPYGPEKTTIHIGEKRFIPDVLMVYGIIFEFYGDYWHANPRKFKENDIMAHGRLAKDIWKKDKERVDALQSAGYRVTIVWEMDYKADRVGVIRKIESGLNWDESYLG